MNLYKGLIKIQWHLQILPSSGEVKRPGGYQNISLQIGPQVGYDDAGRYICLVNNPEGHAHKEMFLEVGHLTSKAAVDGYNNKGKYSLRFYVSKRIRKSIRISYHLWYFVHKFSNSNLEMLEKEGK